MNNIDIKEWIRDMELSYGTIFKYVFLDEDTHIIKYDDSLRTSEKYMKDASDFILLFRENNNEDIAIIEESDDFFDICKFDYTTNEFNAEIDRTIKYNNITDKSLESDYGSENYAYAA